MALKERVEHILRQKKLSKGTFAEKMGVSPARIADYLTGNPTLDTLQKMARALETTIGDLLGEAVALKVKEGFIYLPILDLEASAGHGIVNHTEPIESFLCLKEEEFRFDFQVDPAHVRIIKVTGDSMEPHFHRGDWILVNTQDREPAEAIFVVVFNGATFIKRLQFGKEGFILTSSNPEYAPMHVTPADTFLICGKVVGQIMMKKV